jgi:hypothetical protein
MGHHPWFEPLGRRVATMGLCLLWLAFETWQEAGGLWFWVAAATAAYGGWDLFLSGKYGRAEPPRAS